MPRLEEIFIQEHEGLERLVLEALNEMDPKLKKLVDETMVKDTVSLMPLALRLPEVNDR